MSNQQKVKPRIISVGTSVYIPGFNPELMRVYMTSSSGQEFPPQFRRVVPYNNPRGHIVQTLSSIIEYTGENLKGAFSFEKGVDGINPEGKPFLNLDRTEVGYNVLRVKDSERVLWAVYSVCDLTPDGSPSIEFYADSDRPEVREIALEKILKKFQETMDFYNALHKGPEWTEVSRNE